MSSTTQPIVSILPRHPALQAFVSNYHLIELQEAMQHYQLVPASSKAMLNIPYGAAMNMKLKSLNLDIDRPFLLGLASQSYHFKALQNDPCLTFIVEFTDIGFLALFRHNTIDFVDCPVPLEQAVPSYRLFDLQAQLAEADSIHNKVAVVEAFLLQFLPNKCEKNRLQKYEDAFSLIRACRGMLNVSQLANEFCISERQFRRIITEIKGCPPKDFARLIRFSHIFSTLMQQGKVVNWIDMAMNFHFFDQMHFIREFKQFALYSPGNFQKEAYVFSDIKNLTDLLQRYQTA